MSWDELQAIMQDHIVRTPQLEKTAEYFAQTLQRFENVHSVRWRVKDPEHLAAKIVRRRAKGNKKYSDITVQNYSDIVTDLIGLRALHLFKTDCFTIDTNLRETLELAEDPIAYVRSGDDVELRNQYVAAGMNVKEHPHGYRSVHYVAKANPTKRKIYAEIQVRTLFEEGWSEIDHTVRYPNFSDNPQVAYLLTIFNRLAGSADELGGFVRILQLILSEAQELTDKARLAEQQAYVERDASVAKMEQAIAQLERAQAGTGTQGDIATVKIELEKLKSDEHSFRALKELAHLANPTGLTEVSVNRTSITSLLEKQRKALENLGNESLMKQLDDIGVNGGKLDQFLASQHIASSKLKHLKDLAGTPKKKD